MNSSDLFEGKKALQTLYVSRKLKNAEDLVAWAHEQGFDKCLDPKEMHVTVAYSKEKIDVSEMTDSFDTVNVAAKKGNKGGKREMKLFGEKEDCVVLVFECPDLHHRWEEFIEDFGASWDHDGYHPHVTISYSGLPEGLKLEDIEPYKGRLEFGPEIHQEVNPKWKSKTKEKKTKPTIEESKLHFVQPDGTWKAGDGRSKGRSRSEVEKVGGKIVEADAETDDGLIESMSSKLPATPENLKRAQEFVLKKWRERAAERGRFEPKDLSSSCKFSSMFVQAVFGGEIRGNYDHQFVVLNGQIIDLNKDAEDVRDMEDPYEHDESWFGNDEHLDSMESCKPRVRDWVRDFQAELGLTEGFTMASLDGEGVDNLVALFKKSYEAKTGSSWSEDKIIERASRWTFYGDENGYLAVRVQASGMKKLVAVAGDPKSVLKGIQELLSEGGPVWGVVSGQLATMAKKRGMIVPHLVPGGASLIKTLVKSIPASVFGGTQPSVSDNGGIVLDYDDTGSVTKFFVGNKEYFQSAMKLPMVASKISNIPGLKHVIGALGLNESIEADGSKLYHGTSTRQFAQLRAGGYRAKGLYLGESVDNICEQYALMAAAKDGSEPVIIEVDARKLDGDLDLDIHDGNDHAEAGQYIYSGDLREAIIRVYTWEDGEVEIPLSESVDGNWPTVQFEELWHVGSMNPADKQSGSYEGAGLSVSRHPLSWQRIARGQVHGDIWKLTKPGNRFLDFHRLNERQKQVIIEWGIRHGMVKQETKYIVKYYDDEWEEDRWIECDTMEEAQEEADFMGLDHDSIEVQEGTLAATPKLSLVSNNAPGGYDALVPVYVEAMLPFDGVWWQDSFDPSKLSAPRGVISINRLPSWKAEIDHSADDADDDGDL